MSLDNHFKSSVNAQGWVAIARLAEAAERYEDMCYAMKKVVALKKDAGEDLEVEERNMLSVAYKNVVGAFRGSWRRVSEPPQENTPEAEISTEVKAKYQKRIEALLRNSCEDILTMLDEKLIKKQISDEELKAMDNQEVEQHVFYLKMAGDYNRYLAEVFKSELQKEKNSYGSEVAQNAVNKYEAAKAIAEAKLEPTHPTRLGLALNCSVCYYEVVNEPKKACSLAKTAFDAAIQKLDSLSEKNYKDSTLIMQLLRDNLTIWNSNQDETGQED